VNVGELEAHETAMAWDWDVEDIDSNQEDSKLWVPVVPQMLRTYETPRGTRSGHLMAPTMPPRKMAIYMVQLNGNRLAEQTRTPISLPVQMPCTWGSIVIKAKLGMEDSPRDKDMTMDEDGEDVCSKSKPTNPPAMPKPTPSKGNMNAPRTG